MESTVVYVTCEINKHKVLNLNNTKHLIPEAEQHFTLRHASALGLLTFHQNTGKLASWKQKFILRLADKHSWWIHGAHKNWALMIRNSYRRGSQYYRKGWEIAHTIPMCILYNVHHTTSSIKNSKLGCMYFLTFDSAVSPQKFIVEIRKKKKKVSLPITLTVL